LDVAVGEEEEAVEGRHEEGERDVEEEDGREAGVVAEMSGCVEAGETAEGVGACEEGSGKRWSGSGSPAGGVGGGGHCGRECRTAGESMLQML